MSEPVQHLATVDGGEIHVREWGAGDGPTVLAWHGLARNGADFAPLAGLLSDRFRVLAVDAPGRGLSAWASDPAAGYGFAAYEAVAEAVLDRFAVGELHWIGTSMGGTLGIRLAAGRLAGRIRRLVVNDIGPEVPRAAIDRILAYVGDPPSFASVRAFEAWLRRVYAPYGRLPDAQWRAMALSSLRRRDDGLITVHYDPAIVRQFVDSPDDYTVWEQWEAVRCPVLVLRGARSDLLTPAIAAAMIARNPRARLHEVAECGHAPALNVPEQTEPVREFLEAE